MTKTQKDDIVMQMNELLVQLGFSAKEASVYEYLLIHGAMNAATLAKGVNESRTNTYMLLDKLVERKAVIIDESKPVKQYAAANPQVLQEYLKTKQEELLSAKRILTNTLPGLVSTYNLSQTKPSVTYLKGIGGLRKSFEDQARSKTDLLVWASDLANSDPNVWHVIENGGYKRRAKGIKTRAIFHEAARSWDHLQGFKAKNFELRTSGDIPYTAEVLIYDGKVTITDYTDDLTITVINNQTIADTFRTIFEASWENAKTLDLS